MFAHSDYQVVKKYFQFKEIFPKYGLELELNESSFLIKELGSDNFIIKTENMSDIINFWDSYKIAYEILKK